MDDLMHEVARRMTRVLIAPAWLPTPASRRYRQIVAGIDKLAYGFIARHRENLVQRNTLLAMLMQARDEDGQPMSDRQLRDEAVTLFLAGHETTANALAWTGALLGAQPEHQERIHAELAAVCGDRPAQVADLPHLVYTEAVIRETMRLYPPVPLITREAIGDCMIGPYPIKAGNVVFVSPWVQHRNPELFPDPQSFRPERWLDGLAERLPRFAYMPFGGGPRICIGDRFAMMEAVLILALIVQRFRLEAQQAVPAPFASITLRPVTHVPLRFRAR
jgi:cytochrome P450